MVETAVMTTCAPSWFAYIVWLTVNSSRSSPCLSSTVNTATTTATVWRGVGEMGGGKGVEAETDTAMETEAAGSTEGTARMEGIEGTAVLPGEDQEGAMR